MKDLKSVIVNLPNHRHEGRLLRVGETLTVSDDRAAWMIRRGIASQAPPPPPPQAPPQAQAQADNPAPAASEAKPEARPETKAKKPVEDKNS